MKKIITLLFCMGIFATSFAQYNHGQNDRNENYVYNRHDRFNNGDLYGKDKSYQIDKINREFDYKINSIENDWSLSRHQKKVAIKTLQKERKQKIKMLNAKFYDRNGDYDTHWQK